MPKIIDISSIKPLEYAPVFEILCLPRTLAQEKNMKRKNLMSSAVLLIVLLRHFKI